MPPEDNIISYKEWEQTYKLINNPNNMDDDFWGCMFETYGTDIEYLKANHTAKYNLWTLVDNNPNSRYLDVVPGVHWVNRMGYFVTEVPWTDKDMVVSNDPSYKS